MLHATTVPTQDSIVPQTTALTSYLDRRAILITSSIYLALVWIPLVAAVGGGAMGGFQARNWKSALVAALLPGLLNYAVLALLSPLSPELWSQRGLVITGYNVLLVLGALGASVVKSRLRR